MSSEGLSAVSESFRVISSFGPNHRSPSHSTKTLMLLQRLFVPPSHGDKWTVYTTPEWEMRDNTAPLTLWNTVREAIEQFVSDESVSLWKRQALLGYMDAYAYAAVTGSDEDWKDVTSALEAILDSVGRGKKADSVLEEASSSALRLTRKVANASGLQEYLQLLLDAHSGIDSDDKPFIHAQICGLVAETGRLIASRKSRFPYH
ncbi:uncharacterized protein EMH_0073800 [Eimeria mitis]|uniref:Uncharacterized protein n=1 Tax=Eimeria mitis TaxID=44415 RepID=U6K9X1_9EIME|nr:uncharacterized protein EMH_0073800 [Eimeria mitis]CDJ32268.1 hypothetical protein EMH_0073800 [Eimeria mitis]